MSSSSSSKEREKIKVRSVDLISNSSELHPPSAVQRVFAYMREHLRIGSYEIALFIHHEIWHIAICIFSSRFLSPPKELLLHFIKKLVENEGERGQQQQQLI